MDEIKAKFLKFRKLPFRQGQKEAVTEILDSNRKIMVICGPTGTGKSLIGMMCGAAYDRACYLCSSKQLQVQLVHDFPEAEVMMGRNNFLCNAD